MKSCKDFASYIKNETKRSIEKLFYQPTLLVISCDEDIASKIYVRNKKKVCEDCGIGFINEVINVSEFIDNTYIHIDIYGMIQNILEKHKYEYDKCIIQLPLPKKLQGYSLNDILNLIPYRADIDGLREQYLHLSKDELKEEYIPCTPLGIIKYLEWNDIVVSGKKCVIVGRSRLVGIPMAKVLLEKNGTVTICHSYTSNLSEITKTADILIVATGHKNLITADMVKPGSIVIDVGINRTEEGKICGDVDYDNVKEVAGYVTPVPGGVGVITTAMIAYKMCI